jgi:hypothetical protein
LWQIAVETAERTAAEWKAVEQADLLLNAPTSKADPRHRPDDKMMGGPSNMSKLEIVLDRKDVIAAGAYAEVFWPSGQGIVYKLFISVKHETNLKQGLTDPKDNDRRRKVFDSECAAYEIAGRDSLLRKHIPGSFHRCEIADVRDCGGSVVADYLADCCYAVEHIDGDDNKLVVVENYPHIAQIKAAFEQAGIHHTRDASVFFAEDHARFKLIDFALEAIPPPPW